MTWAAIVVLTACGIFGWGSSLRARAGDLLRWHANGTSWVTTIDFAPTAEETMQIVRHRVPSDLPIYVVRGEPVSETTVSLRGGGAFWPQVPDVDEPIDPATIAVAAWPRTFGSPTLIVTTVYDPRERFDDPAPFFDLRPSPGIRVVVYASDLDPAVSRPKVRTWLRAHLVPYEG
jgi:hypothetical protein